MNIKQIWTETLLDYWATKEIQSDIFVYVQAAIERLGYRATRNQVRLEILTRLRRYGFAAEFGPLSPEQWRIAKDLWRESPFGYREKPDGSVHIYERR